MEKIYGQFDIETISRLADTVRENELSEITITDGERSITIKGKKCSPPPQAVPFMPQMSVQQTSVQTEAAPEAPKQEQLSGNIVKSPIVGTFYAAPSPDKPPFVKVGDKVKKGDVIMIIESMKLMNEIQSEFDGVVEKILVSDAQAVEFDQPIMIIK